MFCFNYNLFSKFILYIFTSDDSVTCWLTTSAFKWITPYADMQICSGKPTSFIINISGWRRHRGCTWFPSFGRLRHAEIDFARYSIDTAYISRVLDTPLCGLPMNKDWPSISFSISFSFNCVAVAKKSSVWALVLRRYQITKSTVLRVLCYHYFRTRKNHCWFADL